MKVELSLSKALRFERGAVVSFVGAGGKTTAMFRLASELMKAGWRVVTTTTTHISEEQAILAPASLPVTQLEALTARLNHWGHCLVVGPPGGHGKIEGISGDAVRNLHNRPDVDVVLVEADGSRMRSFKAPAEHEPVVPPVTTHLVPVVGVDVIDRPLSSEHVHRAERVAALTGVSLSSSITSEIVAKVLTHQNGGAKQRPASARFLPLVNKVETDVGVQHSRKIAEKLVADPNVDAVIVGSMKSQSPVREVWTHVAGIVLAAGEAARFGVTKQLLKWGRTTLVGQAARLALDAGLDPVIVVTGHKAEQVAAAIADLPVQVVFNSAFMAGQSTSVQRGLAALPVRVGAAVFLLVDQPRVTPEVVRTLAQAHRETLAPIVLPTYEGRRGNPVVFDESLFPQLRQIAGDVGGRALFEKYQASMVRVPVQEKTILEDIDTPEDYDRIRREQGIC